VPAFGIKPIFSSARKTTLAPNSLRRFAPSRETAIPPAIFGAGPLDLALALVEVDYLPVLVRLEPKTACAADAR